MGSGGAFTVDGAATVEVGSNSYPVSFYSTGGFGSSDPVGK